MSNSLRTHGLQQSRPPCASSTPGVYSNSCPLSLWCHPTISSSVIPFSCCLQSFSVLGSFPMSQLFTSNDQTIGASASVLVLPMNIQSWFHLGLTDLISLLSKGLSRVFSSTTCKKHQFFGSQTSLWFHSQLYMNTGTAVKVPCRDHWTSGEFSLRSLYCLPGTVLEWYRICTKDPLFKIDIEHHISSRCTT